MRVSLTRQRYQNIGLAKPFRGQSLSHDFILPETIYEKGDPSSATKVCSAGMVPAPARHVCWKIANRPAKMCFVEKEDEDDSFVERE